jgi:hypothetical protein
VENEGENRKKKKKEKKKEKWETKGAAGVNYFLLNFSFLALTRKGKGGFSG